MGSEWSHYSIFGVLTLLFLGFLYQWNKNPKSKSLDKLLRFRKELFGLRKEFFLLNQKQATHDSKIESFISNLKVPKGRGVSAKKVNLALDKREVEFKELLEAEKFLSLCKQRLLEWVKELELLNDKPLKLSLKKYINKQDDGTNWQKELSQIREKIKEFKDNYNLLSHSFSAFQEEARKKLLAFKVKG